MNVAIGSDHAGFELKEIIREYLTSNGHTVKDFGCYSEERADYPDHAHPVANGVEKGEFKLGVLICGSGNGINMSANKHQGIRSALCWEPEIAALARQHNNANIVAMPARFISVEKAKQIVDEFFNNEFEGGRHEDRVNKIACT